MGWKSGLSRLGARRPFQPVSGRPNRASEGSGRAGERLTTCLAPGMGKKGLLELSDDFALPSTDLHRRRREAFVEGLRGEVGHLIARRPFGAREARHLRFHADPGGDLRRPGKILVVEPAGYLVR